MPRTALVLPFPKELRPDRRLLGLTLEDRLIRSARKAGFDEILFWDGRGPLPVLPEAFALLSPSVLLSVDGWRKLASAQPGPGEILLHPASRAFAVLNAPDRRTLEKAFSSGISPVEALQASLSVQPLDLGIRDWTHLGVKEDLPAAEDWLLKGLVKDTEGFMSRHFERRISLSVTRRLVRTPVTPNQMTLVSTGIGIAGAFFFISFQKWYHVIGALLFWLHSVLDGCDGEIARLKFMESRWGGLLDFWGDNVVHSAVFLGIAWGWYRWAYNPLPLDLAFLAVGGTLASAGLVYWNTMRSKRGSGPLFTSVAAGPQESGATQRIADFLARRDFIYLVILFAALDRSVWFLWLGAYGAPIYAAALLFLQVKPKIKAFLIRLITGRRTT